LDFVSTVLADKKARIDKELATCLYKSGRPLSFFEDDYWKEFFKKNFGYTPPSSWALSNTLLDEAYDECKGQVKNQLCAAYSLSLIIDESTDIAYNRIINTSIVTNIGESYY
jgi:hypothetical protein